jgi:hypothetical protein
MIRNVLLYKEGIVLPIILYFLYKIVLNFKKRISHKKNLRNLKTLTTVHTYFPHLRPYILISLNHKH